MLYLHCNQKPLCIPFCPFYSYWLEYTHVCETCQLTTLLGVIIGSLKLTAAIPPQRGGMAFEISLWILSSVTCITEQVEGKNASFVVQGKSPALQCTPVVICNISKLGEYFLDHSWKEAISPECGTSLTGIATLGHIGTWQCGSVVVWQCVYSSVCRVV